MPKSPSFRFYPADFMGSPDVQAMELHEVGSFILLLCTAWQSERHGYLPDDGERLRRWARMSSRQWAQSRELLLSKFPVVEPGWRANQRMVLEAEKQATYSASQALKGKKGGRPAKLGLSDVKPEVTDNKLQLIQNKPQLSPGLPPVKPSVFVSVSDKSNYLSEPEISPEMVAAGVLQELYLSGNDLIVNLEAVCKAAMTNGEQPEALRDALVSSWREYDSAKPHLRYAKGPAKFFGEGDWRSKAGWPWKDGFAPSNTASPSTTPDLMQKLRSQRGA